MPPNISLSFDFKSKTFVLIIESLQVDEVNVWRNRTVDEILLVDIDIHICDSPSNLLRIYLAYLLPIVWVLSIE